MPGSTTASCCPNPDCWRWAVAPTWAYNIADIVGDTAGKATRSPDNQRTGYMKKRGSSKEPQRTDCPPGDREWRRLGRRRWVKKARMKAERRTGVDNGKAVVATTDTVKRCRRSSANIDRLV